MERRRPTYDLDAVKEALGSVETLAMITTALHDAAALLRHNIVSRGQLAQMLKDRATEIEKDAAGSPGA